MSAGCDRMKDVSSRVWRWFFPKRIEAPECLLELLRFVYPTVDWNRVSFYEGWPHVTNASDNNAITLPDTYSPHRIHVYFKPGAWNPCSCGGLGLIVHEGFHVLQLQELLGGWGLGFARPFIVQYLACWPAHGYDDHPMEEAAYVVAGRFNPPSLFEQCCNAGRRACDCSTDPLSVDSAGLAAFQANCANVVQQTSGISFWKDIARCTPGLLRLHRAAKRLFAWGCRPSDRGSIPVPTGPGPGPTDPNGPLPAPVDGEDDGRGARIPLWPFTCLIGLVGAGILYMLFGLYYALWLLAWSVITIALWLARILVEIVGVIVAGILWAVTGIVCAAEWFWDQLRKLWRWFKRGLGRICDWAGRLEKRCTDWQERREKKCTEERQERRQECTQKKEERKRTCAETKEEKKKKCCTWRPCSWACKSWVWVTNVVCVAWTWITHAVCVAWAWVTHTVCVAWTWIVTRTCRAFTWVVKGGTCWSK